MADAVYLAHTTPVGRNTVGEILDYVTLLIGVSKGDLTTTERSVLLDLLNREQEQWRQYGIHGFGESSADYTWVDGNTRIEVPADFAAIRGNYIYALDPDGNPADPVGIVDESYFHDQHIDGSSIYDELPLPIARIWRESDNRLRTITIYPSPTAGDKFRLIYFAHAETLVNNGDELEAPVEAMDGIQYGIAQRWAEIKGNGEMVVTMRAGKAEALGRILGPGKEVKKRMRARFFDERGTRGYQAFTPDRPT